MLRFIKKISLLTFLFAAAIAAMAQPDTLWTHALDFPESDIVVLTGACALADGGYAVCGYCTVTGGDNFFMAKVTAEGEAVWSRKMNFSFAQDRASALAETPDGGLLVVGFAETGSFLILLKLDSHNGDSLRSRSIAFGGMNKAYDITPLSDGNYAVAGYRLGPDGSHSDFLLMKITANADTLWSKRYGADGSDLGQNVIELPNRHMIISGTTNSIGNGDNDFWILEVDSVGTQVRYVFSGTARSELCYGMDINDAGEIFTVGRATNLPATEGFLTKTDGAQSVVWSQNYNDSANFKQIRSIAVLPSGGAVAVGRAGPTEPTAQNWIMLVDGQGLTQWSWTEGNGGSGLYKIIHDGENGFLAVGAKRIGTQTYGYLMRIAPPPGVTGRIVEMENITPVHGVRVSVVGNPHYSVTDEDGRFTLNMPAGVYDLAVYGACFTPDTIENIIVLEDSLREIEDIRIGVPRDAHLRSSLNLLVQNRIASVETLLISNRGSGSLSFEISAVTQLPVGNWLSVSPSQGYVADGETLRVSVQVQSDTTDDGVYDYIGYLEMITNSCPDSVSIIPVLATILDADERTNLHPLSYSLSAYPNPFNPATELIFNLPKSSQVKLQIYDVRGRAVATLLDERKEAGEHSVAFDGGRFGSGIYFAKLIAGDYIQTQKIVLLK